MFTTKLALNFYIVYEINVWPSNLNRKFELLDSTFGAANLTKNLVPDRYSYLEMILDDIHAEIFRYQMALGLVKM